MQPLNHDQHRSSRTCPSRRAARVAVRCLEINRAADGIYVRSAAAAGNHAGPLAVARRFNVRRTTSGLRGNPVGFGFASFLRIIF
jgi:hypothetical protein